MCHTNGTSLRWRIFFPYHIYPEERLFTSIGLTDNQTPLLESSTYFQFLRTSRTPLISVMLIDNIDNNMNGTRIECVYGEARSTTVIRVIGNGTLTWGVNLHEGCVDIVHIVNDCMQLHSCL